MDTARQLVTAEPRLTSTAIDLLDPGAVEVFYDVDIDELMVLFYGTDIVHASHPLGDELGDFSLLVEIGTGRIAGVTAEPFSTRVTQNYPRLTLFLGHATILDGIHEYHWSDSAQFMSEAVNVLRESYASIVATLESGAWPDVRCLIEVLPLIDRDL